MSADLKKSSDASPDSIFKNLLHLSEPSFIIAEYIWRILRSGNLLPTISCVIYHGICSCGHNYIDETIRNAVTRIDEHEQPNDKSEPSKHLKNNPGHKFG